MMQHNQNECRHHGHEKRTMDRRGHAGRGDTGTGDDRALGVWHQIRAIVSDQLLMWAIECQPDAASKLDLARLAQVYWAGCWHERD